MQKTVKSFVIMTLTAVLGMALASPTWAANRDNSWELGFFLPFVMFDEPEISGTTLDVDDAVGYSLRAGYNIRKNHEIELTLTTISTDVSAGGFSADADFTTWQIGYLYNFDAGENLVPFIGGGFGKAKTEVDDANFDEDDTLYFLNGGLRWFFNPTFGLRFEGGAESVDADPDTLTHLYLGAGITFVLGG